MNSKTVYIIGGVVAVIVLIIIGTTLGNNDSDEVSQDAQEQVLDVDDASDGVDVSGNNGAGTEGDKSGDTTSPDPVSSEEDETDSQPDSAGESSNVENNYVVLDEWDKNEVGRYGQDKTYWVFSHQKSCPVCRALEADIKANQDSIPEDVVILQVDYDDHGSDLKKEYDTAVQNSTILKVSSSGELLQSVFYKRTLADLITEFN